MSPMKSLSIFLKSTPQHPLFDAVHNITVTDSGLNALAQEKTDKKRS
jgi:hypothetical protein